MLCMLMHALHGNHDSHSSHNATPNASNESLLEILKRRYALGEITEAQFEQMQRVLGLSTTAGTNAANAPTGHHQGEKA